MPSTFDKYSAEFRQVVRQIGERFHVQEDAADLVKRCDDVLLQMRIESRDTSNESLKKERNDIIKACKMQLESYVVINDKKELFFVSETQQDRMKSQQDQLASQNERLINALQSLNESEQIGTEMTKELDKNREKIESAQGNTNGLKAMMGQADGILSGMIKRSKRWF
jgi:hypothetical protein